MGGENRTTKFTVEKLLGENLHKYGFFYIVRLLECAYKHKPRLGEGEHPNDDPVRFGQEVALSFETATLSRFTQGKAGFPPRFIVRFFGLFGSNGPMPLHLTEYVRERIHNHRDHTLERFADLFHHRMICLFYRAWANTQPTVSFDRPETDKFVTYVGSFAGLGLTSLSNRDAMPDLAKLHYVGYLSAQNKSATSLTAMLADYFQLSVTIEEFMGEWLDIAHSDLTCLGNTPRTGELGISTILGSRVWSCQYKFRIRFKNLNFEEYRSLLPNGQRINQLVAIVRNYIGDELRWDVNLVLKKECVPQARLDGQFSLGWTTWLGERSSNVDADDLKLNPF
jgi:type VI secretion system protein ImpH